MSITLGTHTFDPATTAIREDHQERAGQDARSIRITGLLANYPDLTTLEAALDTILAAASDTDTTPLSLRPNRQLLVRREKFLREIQRDARSARFELILRADDPFEEATTPLNWPWTIAASGATRNIISSGNAHSPTLITLQATGTLINPTLSDGDRTITYNGTLAPGSIIELDGPRRQARIAEVDVTPYCTGEFPRAAPGTSTFTYTDAPTSAHTAQATLSFHERWW